MGRGRGSAGRGNGGRPSERVAVATPAEIAAGQARARKRAERAARRDQLSVAADTGVVTLTPSKYGFVGDPDAPGEIWVRFSTSSGNRAELSFTEGYTRRRSLVEFTVNGMYSQGSLSLGERQAIAMRLLTEMRKDARSRRDGHRYEIAAWGADGQMGARERAYELIGFAPPASPGGTMKGIVRNGRIVPDFGD